MATLTSASATRRRRPQLTREVASLFPLQGEWTEEAYLFLPETNRIVELSEGRLVIPEMPTDSHLRDKRFFMPEKSMLSLRQGSFGGLLLNLTLRGEVEEEVFGVWRGRDPAQWLPFPKFDKRRMTRWMTIG